VSGQLEGRAGIITGAAGGIGRSLAGAFVDEGARVAVLDVDAEGAAAAASELGGPGFGVDITDAGAVETAVGAVFERFGQLDFLVNNAGIRHQAAFLDHGLDEWRRTLDVNLTGAFICSQAVIRRMRPGGRVVNIASIAGVLGLKNRIAYSTTKAGIIGMTKAMAFELGAAGICVNAIGPGVIETSLTASYFEDEAFAALIRENVPLGRWGQTSDLHGAAVFLCGPGAEYVSGQVLCVDGGWVSGKGY
jgi:NAD(P)-dependent dehydrogenase (short-subunit alcohol dehydrogenase family)